MLADCIGRSFPPWTIWHAHGTWYATQRCSCTGAECSCARTLHDPNAGELCRQLAEAEHA
ncbi:hypothetical protein [Planobispora takensis]|uniref:hypothetical protein n=1 Tax=Planobispora takensis TaxID=1367882 RepID=UPI001942E465|nr:hypothetical protein [Planobispora takensis]